MRPRARRGATYKSTYAREGGIIELRQHELRCPLPVVTETERDIDQICENDVFLASLQTLRR